VESPYNLKVIKTINTEERVKVNEKRYLYLVMSKEGCEHPFP